MDRRSNIDLSSDFLTGRQVSEFLAVSERTLYRWHRQRKGPPQIKIGRKVYYRVDALFLWLHGLEVPSDRCTGLR